MDFNFEFGFFSYLIDWFGFSGDLGGPGGDTSRTSNVTTGPIAG